MSERILVVAPHADDELLGCGGTLLRWRAEGREIDWLLVTAIHEADGWPADRVKSRAGEIARVAKEAGFRRTFELGLPAARLDEQPLSALIQRVGEVMRESEPAVVLLPSPADAHSDHRVVFDAVSACTKWFRFPSVRRVMAYETLSETDFAPDPAHAFHPNVFIDISAHLDRKLELLGIYASELGQPPFPRSLDAVRALALLRGAASGFAAAEAFQLLKERS